MDLWDIEKGSLIRSLAGHRQTVYDVAFSGDGTRWCRRTCDRTLILWDAALGRELLILRGQSGSFLSVAFRPDAATTGGGDEDGAIRLFEAD